MASKTWRMCAAIVGVSALAVGCGGRSRAPAGDAGGIFVDMGTMSDMSVESDMGVVSDMGTVVCDEAALATGTSHFYVIHLLSLAAPEGDVSPFTSAGYDVDGDAVVACNSHVVGESAEFAGQSPDFGIGIDNALGGDLGGLANDAVQSGVDAATTLLLVEVRGIDDFTNDSCVGVSVFSGALPAGTTMPATDVDGHLAAGQTFDLLPAIFVDPTARIVAGRLSSGPADFPLTLDFLGAALAVSVKGAQLRFDVSDSGISLGVVGGYLNTDEVMAAVELIPSLAAYVDIVRDTLTGLADIDKDGSPTICEAGSIALKLEGVTATRGSVLAP